MTPAERQRLAQAIRTQMELAGLTIEELGADGPMSRLPTVGQAVANIREKNGYSAKTLKTYRTGWGLLEAAHADDHLDQLNFEDLEQVAQTAQRNAAARWARRNEARRATSRRTYDHDGRGAYETCMRAIRAVYAREYKKAGLPVEQNPAKQVDIPSRPANARRPLTRAELEKVFDIASTGGDDPVLDMLICRTGFESGARQEGLINLRLKDLNHERQSITLDEKFGKKREQPVSLTLLNELERFARERGAAAPEDNVLRYRPRDGSVGRPLTSRRFDTLVLRIRDGDPTLGGELHYVGHLLRHTVGRRIERTAGKAVARRFLGHGSRSGDVTDNYTRTLDGETAAAWSAVMGEEHPLARGFDPNW